jgi:alkylhydroperoxidase family enzyme
VQNYHSNCEKLHSNSNRCRSLRDALEEVGPEKILSAKELTLMRDAGKLNKGPGVMIEEEVLAVRCEGASDEEILEVNQASACFNFSKQTI